MKVRVIHPDTVQAVDQEYVAVARQFFMTGQTLPNARGRTHEQGQ